MSNLYGDIKKPAPPLPQPQLKELRPGLSLLLPLSRRGHGPGLIILVPDHKDQLRIERCVPSPLMKWAEEGYVVVEIQASALSNAESSDTLQEACTAILSCEKCDHEQIGLVSYDPESWTLASQRLSSNPSITVAVTYSTASSSSPNPNCPIPLSRHLAGPPSSKPSRTPRLMEYTYPPAPSHTFALPFQPSFHPATESLSHTRTLTFLKSHVGAPLFDLEHIWDEHTYYEFTDRSVEWTMSTMVSEPYVNHGPTLTGGVGREKLTEFYRGHFIWGNPGDVELEVLSRTVGVDRVVDEFLYAFTHDRVVDWMLPGVPPTHKKAVVPFTAVVNIRGDRLYHEHISWDQGTLLAQLGLMPKYLPFPHPLPKDQAAQFAGEVEYRVPVEGVKTAEKMREKDSVPSNEMFKFHIREK